jgi:DNA invertase Pin-like site-specific DNA recombinase
MNPNKIKKVGIYVRLSKEDARAGESMSIENQKLILTKHVKDNRWILCDIYCDDGFSGTNQNRPALQKMFNDIKHGFINTVLIKDLSRLGRNYLEVGNLAEVFLPEHNCELISLSEKMDEMMVFRNWFNEQHSRETSKKVKIVKRMCALSGKFTGSFSPYGYKKADDNKHLLIPDMPAAIIVRKIFDLRSQGYGHKAIAVELNESDIVPPRDYYYQQRSEPNPFKTCRAWTCVAVRGILENEVYIGNMVQGKFASASYKSHKLITKPASEWIRVENTHEPLVTLDLWNAARSISEKCRRPHKRQDGSANIFCGILYCADCGFKMRSSTLKSERKNGSIYIRNRFLCGTYSRSGRGVCTPHTIGENVLEEIVVQQIRSHAQMALLDENRMVERIIKSRSNESVSQYAMCENELQIRKKRETALDSLIEKLYEDRVSGVIPETAFKNLIQKYEQERLDCQKVIPKLENRLQKSNKNQDETAGLTELIRHYGRIEKLTAQMLLALIKRIEIGENQSIKIIYKYAFPN